MYIWPWQCFGESKKQNRRINQMHELQKDTLCTCYIFVPRGRALFGQHQESRSNTGSPWFTDFPSLCACSESSLTNLIGSGFNLLSLQSHSKPECRWTGPEVAILGADQKERGLWGRECTCYCNVRANCFCASLLRKQIHISHPDYASSARAKGPFKRSW